MYSSVPTSSPVLVRLPFERGETALPLPTSPRSETLARLAAEARHVTLVGREVRGDDLERDRLAAAILGLEDDPHAALPEALEDTVSPDPRSRPERRRRQASLPVSGEGGVTVS